MKTSSRSIHPARFIWPLTLFAVSGTSRAAETAAKVENPVKETDLATVILKPQATQRLGIAVEPVAKKKVPVERLYPGEITLPLAKGVAGSLMALAPPQTPAELLKLADLQATADGDVAQAKVKVDAARTAQERAEKMLAGETSSQKVADDARAAHDLAKAAHDQALAKRALLGPGLAPPDAGSQSWWVRVPIPAADVSGLDPKAPARVAPLSASADAFSAADRVADAPPSANATASTIDWHFLLKDGAAGRRPGERVAVRIPLAGAGEDRLVVPWSAVLHDIHGGQWVYENTAPDTFVRRRVQVERVSGADAVLASGPAPGAKIVVTGAAELFGTEFGIGK